MADHTHAHETINQSIQIDHHGQTARAALILKDLLFWQTCTSACLAFWVLGRKLAPGQTTWCEAFLYLHEAARSCTVAKNYEGRRALVNQTNTHYGKVHRDQCHGHDWCSTAGNCHCHGLIGIRGRQISLMRIPMCSLPWQLKHMHMHTGRFEGYLARVLARRLIFASQDLESFSEGKSMLTSRRFVTHTASRLHESAIAYIWDDNTDAQAA